ncbi:hypothetical protein PHJA_002382800 [Phtheirospermum japonicum]|uniref:Uncharacterized protein n=1 Tax=Phtheirospermum japonicum TaxID=374723 RepID=A0A830CP89_9LAMI|nr:hypothetical protein PHJA_002382800 [Phtheirospermum japonicum]
MEGHVADDTLKRLRHLRENLEILEREFGTLCLNAEVAGRLQQVDRESVSDQIRACQLAQCQLFSALRRPLLQAASPTVQKGVLREWVSNPEVMDSNTIITSVVDDAFPEDVQAATNIEAPTSQPEASSQPSTSGVKEGELNLRPQIDNSKVQTDEIKTSPMQVYQRQWEKLATRRASVYTIAPSFPEISKLPKWIGEAVHETLANNPHLARGDVLELYFISATPEPAKKGFNEAFHFIKLGRPDGNALKYIKATSPEDAPVIVGAIFEDDASTRRAWGLWVCLTKMDKVKYPFKFFQNSANGSFILNSMTEATTSFAETLFETKRRVLWENKIPVSKDTYREFCNMAHVGRWIDRICLACPEQKEPEFGKGFRPKPDRQENSAGKDKRPAGFKKARGPRTMKLGDEEPSVKRARGGDFPPGGVANHFTRNRFGQKERASIQTAKRRRRSGGVSGWSRRTGEYAHLCDRCASQCSSAEELAKEQLEHMLPTANTESSSNKLEITE